MHAFAPAVTVLFVVLIVVAVLVIRLTGSSGTANGISANTAPTSTLPIDTNPVRAAQPLAEPVSPTGDAAFDAGVTGVARFVEATRGHPFRDQVRVDLVDDSPFTRTTLAHELTHALDDQWFDLDRATLITSGSEAQFGFHALVEGTATWVEQQWTESRSPTERAAATTEAREFSRNMVAGGFSVSVVQIIKETLGELDLTAVLSTSLAPAVARTAGEGWGGDRYVVWRSASGASCIRLDVIGDTPADSREIGDGLRSWSAAQPLSAQPGTSVETLTPGITRLTSCR